MCCSTQGPEEPWHGGVDLELKLVIQRHRPPSMSHRARRRNFAAELNHRFDRDPHIPTLHGCSISTEAREDSQQQRCELACGRQQRTIPTAPEDFVSGAALDRARTRCQWGQTAERPCLSTDREFSEFGGCASNYNGYSAGCVAFNSRSHVWLNKPQHLAKQTADIRVGRARPKIGRADDPKPIRADPDLLEPFRNLVNPPSTPPQLWSRRPMLGGTDPDHPVAPVP